jgi:DNA-binding NarL/FixJ family response regulator
MKQFNWPKNMAPNENLWLTILPLMKDDALICNMRLSKKHGMSLPSQTRKKVEAEKPKLDPIAKKIKMLVDEGLDVKVIAKVVDISRQNVAQYIKKHEMK